MLQHLRLTRLTHRPTAEPSELHVKHAVTFDVRASPSDDRAVCNMRARRLPRMSSAAPMRTVMRGSGSKRSSVTLKQVRAVGSKMSVDRAIHKT